MFLCAFDLWSRRPHSPLHFFYTPFPKQISQSKLFLHLPLPKLVHFHKIFSPRQKQKPSLDLKQYLGFVDHHLTHRV
ncbi:hypothetical protein BpHYR1_004007 [Brachionus plicatilis]|uniref:Uncharacterized protein n=1 Tax=Brachionus plicatilis TaxID=10195 RepID=A0A3M7T101_BRAPC|nr:hypothetical protein BpHYR1_004007 [Brachionus plicatilis]